MREELGNQTGTRLAFNLAIVLRIALLLLCSVSTIMAGSQGPKSTRFTSLDFTNSDTISLDLLSPFTLHQTGRGTIPLLTVAGAESDIPLAIRPKGNSFLQLGPDTYGASGWAGSDIATEYLNNNTATRYSYGNYTEIHGGDYADNTVVGDQIFVFSRDTATHNSYQLIGLDVNAFPYLPAGKTMWQSVGAQAQTETYNAGTLTVGYGLQGYVTAKDSSHIIYGLGVNSSCAATENGYIDGAIDYKSTLLSISPTAGQGAGFHFQGFTWNDLPMAQVYGVYLSDMTGKAADDFYLWFDSPGVYDVKSGGVMNYYNPSFTKYVLGASNYERAVQQWNSNVLEYGTQAGGTGTLRGVKILGASLQTPDLTAPTLKVVPQSSPPSSPSEGMIYGNSSDHHLYYYNGSTWKQLDN
jgi:hypothetical protein